MAADLARRGPEALLDGIAFVEIRLHILAINTRLDRNGIERSYVAKSIKDNSECWSE